MDFYSTESRTHPNYANQGDMNCSLQLKEKNIFFFQASMNIIKHFRKHSAGPCLLYFTCKECSNFEEASRQAIKSERFVNIKSSKNKAKQLSGVLAFGRKLN